MGSQSNIHAQVVSDSTRIDSVQVDSSLVDSLSTKPVLPPQEQIIPEVIIPWQQYKSTSMNFVADDSLLRWQIWPNWGEFYAYQKEVISFRQGTTGRIDAFQISGYNPYEQSLSLEGIDLSNPITGLVNYNYVPHLKIGNFHDSKSAGYHSEIELKKYYIIEPISYLNYDEAKFNYRNLEFMVTQNLSERTNIELSFWDRRDGDSYPRNDVLGNQIVARAYHYLSQNVQLRSVFLRNQFENQEPFGYTVNDPYSYTFDRFSSSPKLISATSEASRRDWITGIYQRADSNAVETAGFEVTLSKNEFNLPFNADTLDWELKNYKGNAFKIIKNDKVSLKLEASAGYHTFSKNRNLSISNWSDFTFQSELNYKLSSNIEGYGNARYLQRSDNESGSEYELGLNIALSEHSRFNIHGALFSRMPSIQELHWSAVNYSGNKALNNEKGISIYSELELGIGDLFRIGASGRIKNSNNDVLLSNDSSFVNSGDISKLSGTLYASFQNHRFEFESSATIDAFNEITPDSSATPLDYNEQKIWIRNNAFIKGYAFNRAAYIKLGVRTTFSPLAHGSKFFNTELQYWQANSAEIDIPSFFRLDAELSARVRAIMVVMRWENALDGVGQLGYFEAATFPMPARRLIVGIRAQFRN